MAKKTDSTTLRMVAEVVVGMADYLGSGFDQHRTALDFLKAMKLDDGFRRHAAELRANVTGAGA